MEPELVEYLVSIGALEFCYIDDAGENIYRFTKDAKELVPDIYKEHMKEFNNVIFSLWLKDVVDIIFDEDGEPLIGINKNTYDNVYVDKLEDDEREALKEIIYTWNEIGD